MVGRSFLRWGLLAAACAVLGFSAQGCKGKLPAQSAMAVPHAAAPTSTPTACPFLFQDCEDLNTGNGAFTPNGAGVALALSPYNVTQGTRSLKVTLSTGGSTNLLNLKNFYPNRWGSVAKIVMDVTVDASLATGSFNQISWVAQSSATSKWWSPMTGNVNLVSGSQSVTFNVDWSLGNILPTDVFDSLVLVWNTGGSGTGNFYIDNLRLLSATGDCLPSEPGTCGLLSGFESPYDNGMVAIPSGTNASLAYGPTYATQGTNALQVTLATGGSAKLIYWSGFFPNKWTDVTKVVMDVNVDPALIGAGYNQLSLVCAGTGTYWSPMSAYKDVVAGSQSVTFDIDWTQGTFNPVTGTLSGLYVAWNAGGTGTGTFTFDNVRILNGPSCAP